MERKNSGAQNEHREVGARARPCLAPRACHVVLHGAGRKVQAAGDLLVGLALNDERDHLEFALT